MVDFNTLYFGEGKCQEDGAKTPAEALSLLNKLGSFFKRDYFIGGVTPANARCSLDFSIDRNTLLVQITHPK